MQYCPKCGTPIEPGMIFCSKCGTGVKREDVPEGTNGSGTPKRREVKYTQIYDTDTHHTGSYYSNSSPADEESNGAAVASLVLGIVGLILYFGLIPFPGRSWISIICAIIGIFMGVSGKSKQTRHDMAIAGLVCSIVVVSLWVLSLLSCGACGVLGLSALLQMS